MKKIFKYIFSIFYYLIFFGFATLSLYFTIRFFVPNFEVYASYLIGVIGISFAISSELKNKKLNQTVNLIDQKVFGSLYSLEDTIVAIIDTMKKINQQKHNNYLAYKRDNITLMAYWLWFGMDDDWHSEEDFANIKSSKIYNVLNDRISSNTNERHIDSKTLIVVFDPETYQEKILFFINGLIQNKCHELGIHVNEEKSAIYAQSIFDEYKKALNGIQEQCGRSHYNDEVILCKNNIPNIIFCKEFDNQSYGISFLGEIDFLDFHMGGITDKFFQKNYAKSSEFFGFQTYDPNMVKSLSKQVYLIKAKCNGG